MRQCLALLFLLALPLSAYAQVELDGPWTLTLMPDEDTAHTMHLHAKTVQDTLHLMVTTDEGDHALETVSLNGNALTFVLPTGHGSVTCTLYRKKGNEDFSGICQTARSEIPTTMKRPSASTSVLGAI